MVFSSTPGSATLKGCSMRASTKSRIQPSQRTGLEHGPSRKMRFSPGTSIRGVLFLLSQVFIKPAGTDERFNISYGV